MRRPLTLITAIAVATVAGCSKAPPPDSGPLPMHRVAEVALTGGSGRFDYATVDSQRGAVYLAHMGAGQVIEVDGHRALRTIDDLPDVHGVLVVPGKRRLYATATGRNELVAIDEVTASVVFTAPTGHYDDGLAYDPIRNAVWTTNESAGTETVIDADSGAVRATVDLGGEVGNVIYDSADDRMVVAVGG